MWTYCNEENIVDRLQISYVNGNMDAADYE